MSFTEITPYDGQLPSSSDPASFDGRASALMSWLVANFAPEIQALAVEIATALNGEEDTLAAVQALSEGLGSAAAYNARDDEDMSQYPNALPTRAAVASSRAPDILISGAGNGNSGTLTLDMVERNVGSLASLSSNAVTLPAGEYYFEAHAGLRLGSNSGSIQSAYVELYDTTNSERIALVAWGRADELGMGASRTFGCCISTFASSVTIEMTLTRGSSGWTTSSLGNSDDRDHILKIWRLA
ncbi:hypothetical protein Q4560_05160 [Celeribacter halophilus]|uniref:hypothetical protein n=1 Tax=Celeribacter halophilus TaxID=576117 RepID=UPI0026E32E92|nr:hypothetical protein [Celeribacter halophilus]MDO6722646.1 hypothetical protein [Celeribacter halophilus]